jgi:hypothetical protein
MPPFVCDEPEVRAIARAMLAAASRT